MKMLALVAALLSLPAFAQVTTGTTSTSQQQSSINNSIAFPSGGNSEVGYNGSYTVKSAPTVYAPGLTASMSETCWGSVSGGVSVIGVGATLGATIKDLDCNHRLNAAVAWRMDRHDVAFQIMCAEDDFRAAADKTSQPCTPAGRPVASQSVAVPPLAQVAQPSQDPNLIPVPGRPGVFQYRIAEGTPPPARPLP